MFQGQRCHCPLRIKVIFFFFCIKVILKNLFTGAFQSCELQVTEWCGASCKGRACAFPISEPAEASPLPRSHSLLCQASTWASNVCSGAAVSKLNGKQVKNWGLSCVQFCQFSRSVVSDSLRPHESQHARPPCPSPTPGVYSNSCPSSQWCHPAISSSVVFFSSCPQSLPASGSFPMSQLSWVADAKFETGSIVFWLSNYYSYVSFYRFRSAIEHIWEKKKITHNFAPIWNS